MQFEVVTLFPEIFKATDYGVVGRAKEKGQISMDFWNPRDYTEDSYHKVDDNPYGGGGGMVMLVEPLRSAIKAARSSSKEKKSLTVYLTPQGNLLNQKLINEFIDYESLILVSGRYEGIDERLMEFEPGIEVSIGDYVLSGGELASMVLIDAVTRRLPGVLESASVEQDSFFNGILDYPHYTRPEDIEGNIVPKVLLSGNHADIIRWRRKEALGRTWLRRSELLEKIELTAADRMLLNEFIEDTKTSRGI